MHCLIALCLGSTRELHRPLRTTANRLLREAPKRRKEQSGLFLSAKKISSSSGLSCRPPLAANDNQRLKGRTIRCWVVVLHGPRQHVNSRFISASWCVVQFKLCIRGWLRRPSKRAIKKTLAETKVQRQSYGMQPSQETARDYGIRFRVRPRADRAFRLRAIKINHTPCHILKPNFGYFQDYIMCPSDTDVA